MPTLLLATDDSEPAREAGSYLLRTFSPGEYSLIVVSVASAPDIINQYALGLETESDTKESLSEERREAVTRQARKIGEATADRFDSADFDVSVEAPLGRPGEEICELAEKEEVDTILMGRRGRGRVGELLLGSVSQYVVHHAPCAVTILPRLSSNQ